MGQRTVMIASGARSIALATAIHFAREGGDLILADLPGVRLDEAEAQVEATGAEAPAVALDIRSDTVCSNVVTQVWRG